MTRRFVWGAGLALLVGCTDWPFMPAAVLVHTDRRTYTDTSKLLVTVRLSAGSAVSLDGCPPPFVSFEDSTGGSYPWTPSPVSIGIRCTTPTSRIHLEPGDSVAVAIPMTGFAPGTYRADVGFSPGNGRDAWVAVSNSFVVH